MGWLIELIRSIIGDLIGKGIELAKVEDTADDADPILVSLEVENDPDDLSGLDDFDGLLGSDSSLIRSGDQAA